MNIPTFLKKGDIIALVAPSFGANIEPYKTRLEKAIVFLEKKGYKIKVFGNIFGYKNGASDTKEKRAKAFMDAYLDSSISALWSVSGGEWMMEILPLLDLEKLKKAKPKLFIGYSDNTNLTFLLTTLFNTISVYAPCLTTFGRAPLDPFLKNTLKIISGDLITQTPSEYHQPDELPEKDPTAPYTLTVKTKWINLFSSFFNTTGRLIGGCLDVLIGLVGTKYDNVKSFINNYENDGFIWFIEAAEMDIFSYKRALWQLKEAGWFKGVKGFLIGRSNSVKDQLDLNIYDVTKDILSDLNAFIIMDMDIGHTPPMITLLTGSLVTVKAEKNSYQIIQNI